jgi:hypothetical protein
MTTLADKPTWLTVWRQANPEKVEAAAKRAAEQAARREVQREAKLAARQESAAQCAASAASTPKRKASPKPPTAAPQPAQPPEAKRLLPAGEKSRPHAPQLIGKDHEEPRTWPCDGGKRREQVLDHNFRPPRVVRSVGWRECLKCATPFFSRDVIRQRMCDDCRPSQPPW